MEGHEKEKPAGMQGAVSSIPDLRLNDRGEGGGGFAAHEAWSGSGTCLRLELHTVFDVN